MPMFFFVSGYVAYKPLVHWTRTYALDIFKRKFQAQIIGTVFFYSLLLWCIHAEDPFRAFRLEVHGYWFTLTLFRIFCIYAILSLILRKWSFKILEVILLTLSVAGILIFIYHPVHSPLLSIIGYNTLYFLQFFTMGLLLRSHGAEAMRIFESKILITIIILGFTLCCILVFSYDRELVGLCGEKGYIWWSEEIIRYLGLFLVFSLFYTGRNMFEKDIRTNRILLLIGRRTLDLYFLHYFFLPDLTFLKPYIEGAENAVVTQLIIGAIVSGVIIAVCMGISFIFRRSPFLAQWLFGVKKPV